VSLGHQSRPGTREGAARADIVVVAVNWTKLPAAMAGLPGWNGRIVIGLGSAAGNYAACRTCGTIDRVSRGREGWNAIRQCSSQ
jgi:predicted dinucleotide-binding enzyme